MPFEQAVRRPAAEMAGSLHRKLTPHFVRSPCGRCHECWRQRARQFQCHSRRIQSHPAYCAGKVAVPIIHRAQCRHEWRLIRDGLALGSAVHPRTISSWDTLPRLLRSPLVVNGSKRQSAEVMLGQAITSAPSTYHLPLRGALPTPSSPIQSQTSRARAIRTCAEEQALERLPCLPPPAA